jgi:hypothetical protein
MGIWASDFIASPVEDCTGPVKYSINRAGEPNNIDSTGIVLTCADTGTLVVEIWAYDGAGNSDFCETYIVVQDNMGACGTASPSVAGVITTEESEGVEAVTMSLSGQGAGSMFSQADGSYGFANLVEGYDYTITPERDGDYLNGVSTFDLVLISQHILGVNPLNSPYKIIAADANRSGSVTTLDLIQLRKLILGIDTELANNTSWRFVAGGYAFPEPANPWYEAFPEAENINNLPEAGLSNLNFIAVKIGDVNLDAAVNSLQTIEDRSFDGQLALQAEEVFMESGKEYTVAFSIEEVERILGYQATLTFNTEAVELVEVISGIATEANFGLTKADEGLITTSWNQDWKWEGRNAKSEENAEAGIPTSRSVAESRMADFLPGKASATTGRLPTSTMFSLVLRAKTEVQLSEVLSISSRITKAEAYSTTGSHLDVVLAFSPASAEATAGRFELYQNQPNPFRTETLIGFNLPESGEVEMSITDISGRVVRRIQLQGVKGYNSVVLNGASLPKGILQYTVTAGRYTDTKTMVITE